MKLEDVGKNRFIIMKRENVFSGSNFNKRYVSRLVGLTRQFELSFPAQIGDTAIKADEPKLQVFPARSMLDHISVSAKGNKVHVALFLSHVEGTMSIYGYTFTAERPNLLLKAEDFRVELVEIKKEEGVNLAPVIAQ